METPGTHAKNPVQKKSYAFSVKIVYLYKDLVAKHKDYILSKQILRSGTSVAANIEEALGGQSKKDFIAKLSIAYKESRETRYWLNILRDTDYITKDYYAKLLPDLEEVQKLLVSIIKSAKKNAY